MLATPEPTAEAVWERFAEAAGLAGNWRRPRRLPFIWRTSSTVFAHNCTAVRKQVEIFSRDLRRITGQFPELADEARISRRN